MGHLTNHNERWQLEDLKQRVPLVLLLERDIQLIKKGNKYWACCPFHRERTPSFTIDASKNRYYCFGCQASGDQFSWLQEYHHLDFSAARNELMMLAGIDADEWGKADPDHMKKRQAEIERERDERDARARRQKIELAKSIWQQCQPLAGSLAQTYLAARGIDYAATGSPPTLRFHPSLKHSDIGSHHPAMVAYIQGPNGEFCGIHRTYLSDDGQSKLKAIHPQTGEKFGSKKMLGAPWCGAIRMAKAGEVLAIGEGIETCLSARQSHKGLPVWAAMSLGNMAGEGDGVGAPHPSRAGVALPSVNPNMERPGIVVPDNVRKIIILADNDNKDTDSAMCILTRAANRWRAEGREVLMALPPAGMDFNDLWLSLAQGSGVA